jgi:hypothetical protein
MSSTTSIRLNRRTLPPWFIVKILSPDLLGSSPIPADIDTDRSKIILKPVPADPENGLPVTGTGNAVKIGGGLAHCERQLPGPSLPLVFTGKAMD